MLGRCTLYDYQTNGTMMRGIIITAHRNCHFGVVGEFCGVLLEIGKNV